MTQKTTTERPAPLQGSVNTATKREKARLLEEDEVEALEAKAAEAEGDEDQ